MSTSQVLDRTFQLYRSNFLLFAGIAVPAGLLTAVLKLPFATQGVAGALFGTVAGLVVPIIGQAIASGATAFAVSAVHLNKSISILESYRMLKASFASILGTVVLLNVRALWVLVLSVIMVAVATATVPPLAILAFLTMIVGIVVVCVAFCIYALAVPACAVERLSPKQSLLRSRFLTDGIGKQIVIIYILGWIIDKAAIAILLAPQSLPLRFGHAPLLTGLPSTMWSTLAVFLSATLAGPVTTITFSVLYYDQRVRKEAFDLDQMIAFLERHPAPAQTVAHTGAS